MIHVFSTEQARWQIDSAVSPVAGSPIAIGEPVGKPFPFEKIVTIGGENRSLKPRSFNTFVW
ncbi:MAG: hypothetical protein IJX59_08790 [Clostridia bacterium]|nr:hypothetical protein [Clostridia bacterium]MBQ9130836.1 hypothetical protein [Clostridia bacterium]